MAKKENLLLLFDRPKEPVFTPRGDQYTKFDIPLSYLPEKYKKIGVSIVNRFNDEVKNTIKVDEIPPPNLNEIEGLAKDDQFSLFIPKHSELAGQLISIFMACKDINELQSKAVYARGHCNPMLFNYAFSVALLHRSDTQDLDVPSLVQAFPDKFVDSKVIDQCREALSILPDGQRSVIEIPRDYTASDLEVEHRLAYFREDIGVNLHHWHWHLVYPFNTDRNLVAKNRRGELFYYMHQQIMARYNVERLCNQMKRVRRFNNFRDPIQEAYFPKLDNLVSSRAWPSRVENQVIQDINRPADSISIDVEDLFRWRDRIYSAIHAGFVQDERGNRVDLTENEGIDILGNIFESSILSPNRTFYGNLHNMLHMFLAYVHDPDHRHLEFFGVVGDSATAMRDPVFYPVHAFVDDVFQEFKATLPRYTIAQLNYQGVTVQNVQVLGQGGRPNELNTFWQQSDVNLSRGMDFQPRGPVLVRFTHLQHHPFTYNVTVNNQGSARQGTCRIFLAPKFDERGNPWLFRDQRLLFIEMDRFTVNLNPGQNTITRKSSESAITIPFERTFRNVDANRPTGGDALEAFNYCGCGWPQHMLVPRGNAQGYTCHLFAMISNYADDRIDQNLNGACENGSSFCGIRSFLYPDRRSMGYPFDRMPRDGVDTLQQFLTPNMRVQEVVIRFTDQILQQRK